MRLTSSHHGIQEGVHHGLQAGGAGVLICLLLQISGEHFTDSLLVEGAFMVNLSAPEL